MFEADEVFRTDDIVLTTLLVSRGHEYKLERLGRHKVAWVFSSANEDLNDLVTKYDAMSIRVEPLTFQRELARVRNDMFDFLGVPGRRSASSEASSASAA